MSKGRLITENKDFEKTERVGVASCQTSEVLLKLSIALIFVQIWQLLSSQLTLQVLPKISKAVDGEEWQVRQVSRITSNFADSYSKL